MYEGELRKYDEGELCAYFKGADRLFWDLRDFIERHKGKKINKEYLIFRIELAYHEWEQFQIDFGLSDNDFSDDNCIVI